MGEKKPGLINIHIKEPLSKSQTTRHYRLQIEQFTQHSLQPTHFFVVIKQASGELKVTWPYFQQKSLWKSPMGFPLEFMVIVSGSSQVSRKTSLKLLGPYGRHQNPENLEALDVHIAHLKKIHKTYRICIRWWILLSWLVRRCWELFNNSSSQVNAFILIIYLY